MIKAAMAGREEYWKQYPAMVLENGLEQKTKLPPINGAPRPPTGEINRWGRPLLSKPTSALGWLLHSLKKAAPVQLRRTVEPLTKDHPN